MPARQEEAAAHLYAPPEEKTCSKHADSNGMPACSCRKSASQSQGLHHLWNLGPLQQPWTLASSMRCPCDDEIQDPRAGSGQLMGDEPGVGGGAVPLPSKSVMHMVRSRWSATGRRGLSAKLFCLQPFTGSDLREGSTARLKASGHVQPEIQFRDPEQQDKGVHCLETERWETRLEAKCWAVSNLPWGIHEHTWGLPTLQGLVWGSWLASRDTRGGIA